MSCPQGGYGLQFVAWLWMEGASDWEREPENEARIYDLFFKLQRFAITFFFGRN